MTAEALALNPALAIATFANKRAAEGRTSIAALKLSMPQWIALMERYPSGWQMLPTGKNGCIVLTALGTRVSCVLDRN